MAPRLAVDDDRRPGGRADPRTDARVRQVARERPSTSSIRIGSPARIRSAIATSEGSSHGQLEPAGNGFGPPPHVPTTVTLPSRSQRKICTISGRSISPTSRAIAANTSADRAPVATSTATRRSASCCSASVAERTPTNGSSDPGTSAV